MDEAPGHYCLEYEAADVVTVLQLCVQNGWDAHVIPVAGYAQAFISHHEWLHIGFDDERQMEAARRVFASGN